MCPQEGNSLHKGGIEGSDMSFQKLENIMVELLLLIYEYLLYKEREEDDRKDEGNQHNDQLSR